MSSESGEPSSPYHRDQLSSVPSNIIRSSPVNLLPLSSPEPSAGAHRINFNPSIAIIGAGITGLTAAAHRIGHSFTNLTIFDSSSSRGGIWNGVPTSTPTSLQINTAIYRPSVPLTPSGSYSPDETLPKPQPILSQIRSVSERYDLPSKTRFNTKVEDIYRDHDGRWIINPSRLGSFDGVICYVGSVGEPRVPRMPRLDGFHRSGAGQVWHSSKISGETRKCDVNETLIGHGGMDPGAILIGSPPRASRSTATAGDVKARPRPSRPTLS
ncbi:hypothetical protein QBC42DRAFT_248505 [Cladorrhinum samala]|uniref:Uncharacterized protein n=1 Tax=Cladorrhinum samala TaxID=585594 RepID=A0AAV9HWU0_9PEZI|nr:hypothetical protein QBC42DRAFT_248505 [Cladorrhinum samala]